MAVSIPLHAPASRAASASTLEPSPPPEAGQEDTSGHVMPESPPTAATVPAAAPEPQPVKLPPPAPLTQEEIGTTVPAADAPGGIPQSSAAPAGMLHHLNAEDMRRRAAEEKNVLDWARWRADAHTRIFGAVLGDPKARAGVDISFDKEDPERAWRKVTVDAYLRSFIHGKPLPKGPLGRDLLRYKVSLVMFHGRGGDSDEAFHAELVKAAQGRKDFETLSTAMGEEASKSMLLQSLEPGAGETRTFADWRKENAAKIAPGQESLYMEMWNDTRYGVGDSLRRFGPELKEVWGAMKQGGGGSPSNTGKAILLDMVFRPIGAPDHYVSLTRDEMAKRDAGAVAFDIYDKLSEEDRGAFLGSLGLLVKALPKEARPSAVSNLLKTGGRMVDDLGRGSVSRFTLKGLEEEMNQGVADSKGPWGASEAEKKEAQENADRIRLDRLKQKNFVDEVRRMEREDYDPIRHFSKDSRDFFSLRTLENGIYGIPSVGASLGMMMLPGGGLMMYEAMRDSAYRDLRDHVLQSQKAAHGSSNEEAASLFAESAKSVVALPQTFVERMQSLGVVGRTPGVKQLMKAVQGRISGHLMRAGGTGLAATASETLLEEAQYQMPYVVQELAAALPQMTGIPAPEWYNGKDGAFDGFWTRQGSTFLSMSPLAIPAGKGSWTRDKRAQAFAEASPTHLAAFGLTQDGISGILEAKTQGQASLNEAVDRALAERDPFSESAKTAVEDLARLEEERMLAAETLRIGGDMPRFVSSPDGGWTLHDKEGRELGKAATNEEALRMAAAHTDAIHAADADQIAYLATMLEAGSITSATDAEGVRQTTTDFRPGQRLTLAQAIAEDGISGSASFSIAPSNPERDARQIKPLVIPSEILQGNRADWRKVVRDYIAEKLQGRTLINKDSGRPIHFNSQSRGEAPSKLRKEQAFRTATEIESITEEAVFLGSSAPGKGREADTSHFNYYAIPVEIDGHHAVAWFNARKPKNESPENFYEFGLYESPDTKRARATQRPLGKTEPPIQVTSQPGPAQNIGEFLGQIKDTLPAAVKVAADSSGQRLTLAQAIAESGAKARRIAAQLRARELVNGGDGSLSDIIFGSSTTHFEEGVRHTTNRLQQGASVLTVFHEETHGFWKEALATGRITRQEAITFLRAVDTVLSTRTGREGQSLRLLPEGDVEITDVHLDEAIAELREAEILRTRKDGGLPPGLVSRNLAAIARLSGQGTAGKFKAFFDGIRSWFGVALDRSVAIRRGLADGSISQAEYEGFFGKLTGKEGTSSVLDAEGNIPISTSFSISPREAIAIRSEIEGQKSTELSTEGIPSDLKAKEAVQWMKSQNAEGKTIHPSIGEIEIRNRGVKNAIGHLLNPRKAAALLKMKELIPGATVMQFREREGASNSYRLARRVTIDGTDYVARIVIDTDANGNRYYNHELSDLTELRKRKDPQPLIPGVDPKGQQIGVEEIEDSGKLLQWIYSVNEADLQGTSSGSPDNSATAANPLPHPENLGGLLDDGNDLSFSLGPAPSLIRPLDPSTHTDQNEHHERLREPLQILEALGAETHDLRRSPEGLRTNEGKRRKSKQGRQLTDDPGILAWAQRHGRILDPGPIEGLRGQDAPHGGEHTVIIDGPSRRVIKLTKPGLFGAQAEDAIAYLERWALHNRAFGDDVAFEGLVTLPGEHAPRAVISQRYAEGRDATMEEQADFLNGKGFHEQPDGRWIHPIRGITVWDTITPGNVIATADGMRVIDLQVAPTPSKELAEVRLRTGIGRETSFSIGSDNKSHPQRGDDARLPAIPDSERFPGAEIEGEDQFFNFHYARRSTEVSPSLSAFLDEDGVITYGIKTPAENSPVRGKELFDRMMEHFGERVKAIRAEWYCDDPADNDPRSNIHTANQLTSTGKAMDEAAAATFTGKMAARHGFTAAKVMETRGTPGNYTKVIVIFQKP
ncbi:MAG: hypothetical protein KF712_04610 [Akkermansiaceae bacterium]|nr:hypothetical protein [Akkermansiaceae bacterium]